MVDGESLKLETYDRFSNSMQDIAPTYYDIESFGKGPVKSALLRTMDKIRRRTATKGGRR